MVYELYVNYKIVKEKKNVKETCVMSDTVPGFRYSSKTIQRKKGAGTKHTLRLSLEYGFLTFHSAPRG